MSSVSQEVLETRKQAEEMRDKLCRELAKATFDRAPFSSLEEYTSQVGT